MRFLVDECTGPRVAAWLRDEGHEVLSVFDDLRGLDDESIIQKAESENWILVTNDKEFGERAHREKRPHPGLIVLRLSDERSVSKIRVLSHLLKAHFERIPGCYTVVTEKRIRFISL